MEYQALTCNLEQYNNINNLTTTTTTNTIDFIGFFFVPTASNIWNKFQNISEQMFCTYEITLTLPHFVATKCMSHVTCDKAANRRTK